MTRIAVPVLTVLLAVASLLGVAGWNRSTESQPPLTLTERELGLPWSPVNADQGLGVRLRFEFERRSEPLDARNWLPEARLRDLGFPLNVPTGDPAASAAYADVPSRVAWVVFEYNGPAFQEIERRRALRREANPFADTRPPSRLVPVEAGLDVEPLRKKYGAEHLIVRAIISLTYTSDPLLYAWVRELVPASVTVPRSMLPLLAGLQAPVIRVEPAAPQPPDTWHPRYEVDLGVGQLGIPFVKAIRRIGV
jgi:hypothetical protein